MNPHTEELIWKGHPSPVRNLGLYTGLAVAAAALITGAILLRNQPTAAWTLAGLVLIPAGIALRQRLL